VACCWTGRPLLTGMMADAQTAPGAMEVEVTEESTGSFKLLATLAGHTEAVWCVSWHPSGDELASCSGDNTVRVWRKDPASGEWVTSEVLQHVHKRTVRSCAFSPCGTYLASASFDATTAVWERQAGAFECIATLEVREAPAGPPRVA
jgi:WD40 repeat protein